MTEKEIVSLNGQETISGALKGVNLEDYEVLQRTAWRVSTVDAEREKVVKRAEAAEKQAAATEARAKQAMEEKPPMKLQMENAQFSGRLEHMERRLRKTLDLIPEQLKVLAVP